MINHPIVFVLINLIFGSSVLIYGVNFISEGLEKANIKVIKRYLVTFTKNVWSAFVLGTVATAITQSSTAIMLLTVGFVNAGIMSLNQAVGIIYGANIGTTITAQLMSYNLNDIAMPAILLGVIIGALFFENKAIRSIGKAVVGLGLMFGGIRILNLSIPCIKESETIFELFRVYGQNPYIGVLIGLTTTALVHSSSATVGLTIVLYNSQLISFDAALGLILGDNIGTCVTAQIATIAASIAAKRTAWAHTLYNIIGTIIALIFFRPFIELIRCITFLIGQDNTRLIVNAHTTFNIISAVIFLPITKYYVRFIKRIIPEKM